MPASAALSSFAIAGAKTFQKLAKPSSLARAAPSTNAAAAAAPTVVAKVANPRFKLVWPLKWGSDRTFAP
jgi:hypothetical protein